jgi:hypothetical protein
MCQFTTLLFGKKRFFEPEHPSVYNFIYETDPLKYVRIRFLGVASIQLYCLGTLLQLLCTPNFSLKVLSDRSPKLGVSNSTVVLVAYLT